MICAIGGTFGATPDDRPRSRTRRRRRRRTPRHPAVTHFDSLGRHLSAWSSTTAAATRYPTRTALRHRRQAPRRLRRARQAGGGVLSCARRKPAAGFAYVAGSDMAGNQLYHINADGGGARRSLGNVAGNPIRSWDARGHAFRTRLRRGAAADRTAMSAPAARPRSCSICSIYGEGRPPRICAAGCSATTTRPAPSRTAGTTSKAICSPMPASSAVDYHQSLDWSPLADLHRRAPRWTPPPAPRLMPTGDGGRTASAAAAIYDALNRADPGGHAAQRDDAAERDAPGL